MSLSCELDNDGDYDWYFESNYEYRPLATKRSRKCSSCGKKIEVAETSMMFATWRRPSNDIEERIYDDEVPTRTRYMCEECGDLALSLNELKFCYDIDSDLKKQIKNYREEDAAWNKVWAK